MYNGNSYDFDFSTITQSSLSTPVTITPRTLTADEGYSYSTKKKFALKCTGVFAPSEELTKDNIVTVAFNGPNEIAKNYDTNSNADGSAKDRTSLNLLSIPLFDANDTNKCSITLSKEWDG